MSSLSTGAHTVSTPDESDIAGIDFDPERARRRRVAPEEVPIYGEDWLERRGQTLEEARKKIPNLQTYRKGPGEKIPDWRRLEASIHGTDVSRQMMRISMMNLVLHGIRHANLKRANVLSEMSGLTEDDLHRRYRVLLSNPPFAGQVPGESIRRDLPTRSKKSELLFLALMLRSLAPGGRCAVVVPEGALFGSTRAHKDLRERLLRECELLAVVSLPAGSSSPTPASRPRSSSFAARRPNPSKAGRRRDGSGSTRFGGTGEAARRGGVMEPTDAAERTCSQSLHQCIIIVRI